MTKLERLFLDLRYHQMLNRLDARSLRAGKARCKRIAEAIRTYDPRQVRRVRRKLKP